jgi:hypothetical protein
VELDCGIKKKLWSNRITPNQKTMMEVDPGERMMYSTHIHRMLRHTIHAEIFLTKTMTNLRIQLNFT